MKWIKIKKELPPTGVPVLAFGINSRGEWRTIRAFYAEKYTLEGNGDDYMDYDEDQDLYFIPEGWYEKNEFEDVNWYVDFDVTHWMPLPPPPKLTDINTL